MWLLFWFVVCVLLMMHGNAFLINRTCPVSDCKVVHVDLSLVSITLSSMRMAQILKTAGGFRRRVRRYVYWSIKWYYSRRYSLLRWRLAIGIGLND